MLVPSRDEETGQYEPEFTDDEFLAAIETHDTATTTKIAETVGCSYDLAYRRLHQLVEENELRKEKIGNTFVWKLG